MFAIGILQPVKLNFRSVPTHICIKWSFFYGIRRVKPDDLCSGRCPPEALSWGIRSASLNVMNKRPLYFDYAATTPVDERVIQVMVECLGFNANFGNPASSSHAFGQAARHTVEQARRQVAELVGAQPEQIVWTSGATESNNLAIKGVAQARGVAGGHIITSQIEHKATLDTARQLQDAGVAVTYLVPDAEGLISAEAVSEALREDTFLVSLMLVNNELGTLNDIPAIGARVREHGALLHVDAAQGAGKVAIDLAEWQWT